MLQSQDWPFGAQILQAAMAICSECEQFDLQSFRSDSYTQRGYAYEDVKKRASTCEFCGMLHEYFKAEPGQQRESMRSLKHDDWWIHFELLGRDKKRVHIGEEESFGVAFIRTFLGVRYTLQFGPSKPWVWPEYPRGKEMLLVACADEGSPAATSGDILGRFCDRSLPSTNHKIEEWLALCLQHELCRCTSSGKETLDPFTARLPTRCINVGTANRPELFLEETGTKCGAYITLSHRWSDSTKACSTTTSNYQQRQSNMNGRSLPRVFQDTIEIARRLRAQYLWIDCLCVIQDSTGDKDFKDEATRMADYYQRSLVTFSALNSDRLIPGYSSFDKPLIRLSYRSIKQRLREGHLFLYMLDPFNDDYRKLVQNSELLSRAWVFQEYMLSRRIIHFAESTIIFECQSNRPETDLGETVQEVQRDGSRNIPVTKQRFALETGVSNAYTWYEIVEVYSTLRFTYPEKDRTVALSGFASEYKAAAHAQTKLETSRSKMGVGKQGSQYIEGLWIDHAYVGLLWEKAEVRSHDLLAKRPTWSWTRIYAPVVWRQGRGKHCKQRYSNEFSFDLSPQMTYRAYTSLDVHDPSPGMNVAGLTLRSRLLYVTVDRLLKADEIGLLFEDKIRPRSIDDHYRAVRDVGKSHRLCGWATFDHDEPIHSPQAVGVQVRAMHISTLKHLDRGFQLGYFFTLPSAFYVLFVRNVHDNVFERIGMGCLFGLQVDDTLKQADFQEVVLI